MWSSELGDALLSADAGLQPSLWLSRQRPYILNEDLDSPDREGVWRRCQQHRYHHRSTLRHCLIIHERRMTRGKKGVSDGHFFTPHIIMTVKLNDNNQGLEPLQQQNNGMRPHR